MTLYIECSPAVQEVPGSIRDWDATVTDALCRGWCRWPWSSTYKKFLKIFSLCHQNNDKKCADLEVIRGGETHAFHLLGDGNDLDLFPRVQAPEDHHLVPPTADGQILGLHQLNTHKTCSGSGFGHFWSDGSDPEGSFRIQIPDPPLWRKTATFVKLCKKRLNVRR